MATGILKVDGERVVDEEGNIVILRGAGIGGWMKYVLEALLNHDLFLQLVFLAWKTSLLVRKRAAYYFGL